MPKTVKDVTPHVSAPDPESLAGLREDCARMARDWTVPPASRETRRVGRTPISLIHGVSVPARSARLLDGMSEYGD
ncbi:MULTISPECIES: hypothetical protein [Streptomyces]|uniref:Uncharacterized protein n=3 Tax=Streptomyces TaxID=1883 RepID=A0A3Q9FT87_STRLT|nr:hypothetical protein [Streptomyces luteoverticillatus]AZQ71238.1 hypothetical protein EKH77_08440 [Streptomyces luteoverticillatus]